MASGSISFDRAASYYDRTRVLGDAAMARLIPLVVAELSGSGRVLEVGIGTGRIGLPLMREGVDITGVDISREMLERLREKAGRHAPPLAIADATHLPFPDGTFGAAIAAHVLHLIPTWRDALAEMARVVRPGGLVLASRGGRNRESEWRPALRRQFFRLAGQKSWPPGADRIEQVDDEMREQGASVKELPQIRDTFLASVNQTLEMLEQGIWSACWAFDDETRRRAAAATRDWAAANLGDLDEPRPVSEVIAWRAYRLR
jgi:ubiquinone/menaquinone biosynthesis C-methylase UbiE